MTAKPLASRAWLLALPAFAAMLLAAAPAMALRFSASEAGGAERLTLHFEAGSVEPEIDATPEAGLLVRLPSGIWSREPRPADAEIRGRLLTGLIVADDGVLVGLSNPDVAYRIESGPGRLTLVFLPPDGGPAPKPATTATTAASAPDNAGPEPAEAPAPHPQAQPAAPGKAAPAEAAETAPEQAPAPVANVFHPIEIRSSLRAKADLRPVVPARQASPAATPPASGPQAAAPSPARPETETPHGGSPEAVGSPSAPQPASDQARADAAPERQAHVLRAPASLTPRARPDKPAPARPEAPADAHAEAAPAHVEQGHAETGHDPAPAATEHATVAKAAAAAPDNHGQPAAHGEKPADAKPDHGQAEGPAGADHAQAHGEPAAGHGDAAKPDVHGGTAAVDAHGGKAEGNAHGDPAKTEGHGPTKEQAAAKEGDKGAGGHGGSSEGKGAPPEDPAAKLYGEAMKALGAGDYAKAAQGFKAVLALPECTGKMRSDVLYSMARSAFKQHENDLAGHFQDVVGPLDQALNTDPDSPQAPLALLQTGIAHLHVDNTPEAGAYFNLLRQKYPRDPNVPYIDYYWGDYYYRKGRFKDAADVYQKVLKQHPDAPILLESAMGLARSLERLEYFDQANEIVDFIGKRWPRYHIDNPEFLRLSGELAARLEKNAKAKQDLWNYYNLNPSAPGNDMVLARLGDIYLRTGQKDAARELYEAASQRYPEEEGGLVSRMRLAEEGIYDAPTLDQMRTVFERPFTQRPEDIYTQIVSKHPQSPLAPLAQLKLAMWRLISNRPWEALEAAAALPRMFPDSNLKDKAGEVAAKAFTRGAEMMIADQNYGRIVDAWQRYPILRDNAAKLPTETRLAMATSLWQEGKPDLALAEAKGLMAGGQTPAGQAALSLALNIQLGREDWPGVEQVAEAARGWALPEEQRRQMDYALALALERQGKAEQARPHWERLAGNLKLEPGQRALALHALARSAQARGDVKAQYLYAQEAVAQFITAGEDKHKDKIKDDMLMLMEAGRKADRLDAALYWAKEYDKRVTDKDPDWDAHRYRTADIQRALGDQAGWAASLTEIIARRPDGIYARMAKAALQTQDLEKLAGRLKAASKP